MIGFKKDKFKYKDFHEIIFADEIEKHRDQVMGVF